MSQEEKKQIKKRVSDGPGLLDYSFMHINVFTDVELEEPRLCGKKMIPNDEGKYDSKCLRLNNNVMSELTGFQDFICKILVCPEELSWIDLSQNELTKIDAVLCDLPNLQILNLHGNSINDIKETDKLVGIGKLRKLSLHGNPIESVKNYRFYVLSKVPQLANFDMSAVTKADKATAATWKQSNSSSKKKSRKIDD